MQGGHRLCAESAEADLPGHIQPVPGAVAVKPDRNIGAHRVVHQDVRDAPDGHDIHCMVHDIHHGARNSSLAHAMYGWGGDLIMNKGSIILKAL